MSKPLTGDKDDDRATNGVREVKEDTNARLVEKGFWSKRWYFETEGFRIHYGALKPKKYRTLIQEQQKAPQFVAADIRNHRRWWLYNDHYYVAEDSLGEREVRAVVDEKHEPDPEVIEGESESTLRPRRLKDFIGQDRLKENLAILIRAARARGEPLEHILFYGPPGLGKTTLAHIIAAEMETNITITAGQNIEKGDDLVVMLVKLQTGDILFIDEIHRLKREIEENLPSAMEDRALDLIVGEGVSARSVRLPLAQFTIVGETTRLDKVNPGLRACFDATYRLDFYSLQAMEAIVKRLADILDVTITEEAVQEIGKQSRGTPKVANRLLRRARDYAQVKSDGHITRQMAESALALFGVDPVGLDFAKANSARQRIPDDVKIFVWNRDGGRCVNCGSKENLEYDHVIPVNMGGSNTARNLQLLCETCNRSKGGNLV